MIRVHIGVTIRVHRGITIRFHRLYDITSPLFSEEKFMFQLVSTAFYLSSVIT